jgi:carboxylesterase
LRNVKGEEGIMVLEDITLSGGEHAVLLLHGLAGSNMEIAWLAQSLHRGGLSVQAPVLPGYTFGAPSGTWVEWRDAARRRYRELRARHASVSVAGISMGATLALALAEAEPEVPALALLSTTLFYDGWAMPWYRFMLGLAAAIPFSHRYSYRECEPFGIKNQDLRARVRGALAGGHVSEVGGESISLGHLREARLLAGEVRAHLGAVRADALLVHSIDDETASPKNAEAVLRGIASGRREIIYLGDCYHMITVDNERETVFYEVERFIKQSVNLRSERPVFDLPDTVARQLKRRGRGQPGTETQTSGAF